MPRQPLAEAKERKKIQLDDLEEGRPLGNGNDLHPPDKLRYRVLTLKSCANDSDDGSACWTRLRGRGGIVRGWDGMDGGE